MVVNSGVCREGLIDVVSDDHISANWFKPKEWVI